MDLQDHRGSTLPANSMCSKLLLSPPDLKPSLLPTSSFQIQVGLENPTDVSNAGKKINMLSAHTRTQIPMDHLHTPMCGKQEGLVEQLARKDTGGLQSTVGSACQLSTGFLALRLCFPTPYMEGWHALLRKGRVC